MKKIAFISFFPIFQSVYCLLKFDPLLSKLNYLSTNISSCMSSNSHQTFYQKLINLISIICLKYLTNATNETFQNYSV